MAEETPLTPAVPGWQRTLLRWLGPAVCGVALNQLADVVPYLVVGGALLLVAVLYGLSRLDATAPLVRGLPRMLLRVITAGLVAALVLPASWSRPVIGSLVLLIVLLVLLTPQRGTVLASLIGICLFTYGVTLVFLTPAPTAPALLVAACTYFGVMIALGGLAVLSRPERVVRPTGVTVASLRRLRQFLYGAGNGLLLTTSGVIVLLCVIALTDGEYGPVAVAAIVLVLIAALAVAGVEVVLWLPERHSPVVGVLLVLGGVSLTAVGCLIGFTGDGRDLIAVPLLGTSGMAMVVGGLTLLDATGALPRLRDRLTYLVTRPPAGTTGGPPRENG
ncbi:hypothetical protein [Actinoplanes auranticolor]|uniref:Uncharacterized protein n=1 Tax=Actinoplanes auranticolor TaxID=47988 RepID=A0A919SIP2_9ACTN|nr:hypothetical protein [Actinoplanes auranticolor]GIM72441.1 hypothetical protein Aau02nite_51000 [Actinoplanes auranticolor]